MQRIGSWSWDGSLALGFVVLAACGAGCGGGDSDGSGASDASAGLDASADGSISDAAKGQDADVVPATPTPLATSLAYPWCIAGDATNLYYCSADEIWTVPIAGGTPTKLAKNPNQANNLAIAVTPSTLYVLDYAGATANVPLPGGGWSWNSTAGGLAPGFGVVFDGSSLYWVSQSAGDVVRVGIGADGGAASAIVTGQTSPVWISGDATSLFWANSTSSGAIIAKALPSGAPASLTAASNPQRLTSDANHVYYVAAGSAGFLALFSVPRNGGAATEICGHDSGLPLGYAPGALASDGANVYFAVSNGTLYKASPSGSAHVVVPHTAQVTQILVDATNLYWIEGDQVSTGTLNKMPKP